MSTVMKAPVFVPRYSESQRVTHWLVALSFVVATLSGLALFHPAFWFLSGALGGGVWSKTLHPWAGLVMVIAFVPMAAWYWKDNILQPYDIAWMKRLPEVLNNSGKDLPEIDKYNAGQKMLFWSIIGSLVLLLASGLVLWYHPELKMPVTLVRISGVLHVLASFVLFLGMLVHIYSAVFWIRGSMRAMIRGEVKAGWAKHHHPLWYKRVRGRDLMSLAAASAALALLAFTSPALAAADAFEIVKDGIPKPLTSTPGSAARGKALLQQKQQANCLNCHRTRELKGGNSAPILDGIALGKTEAQLRLSVVDYSKVKPGKAMPVFHNVRGEEPPRLSAQEVEDIVAYLLTLRQSPRTGVIQEEATPPSR